MDINFTPNFNLNSLMQNINKRVNQVEQVIIDQFARIGEQFVADARNNGDYTDRTGNLRSSVGYVIFKDGKPIEENFEEAANGTDKATGMEAGKATALNAEVPNIGFCLVVVAGMNYAVYVEAKNYDVITGSSYKAEKGLRNAIKIIQKKL